jgi:hypothetical protein
VRVVAPPPSTGPSAGPPGRVRSADRGPASGIRAALLRLRPHRLRRVGRRPACRAGPRSGPGENRTLRLHRRLTCTPGTTTSARSATSTDSTQSTDSTRTTNRAKSTRTGQGPGRSAAGDLRRRRHGRDRPPHLLRDHRTRRHPLRRVHRPAGHLRGRLGDVSRARRPALDLGPPGPALLPPGPPRTPRGLRPDLRDRPLPARGGVLGHPRHRPQPLGRAAAGPGIRSGRGCHLTRRPARADTCPGSRVRGGSALRGGAAVSRAPVPNQVPAVPG